MIVSTLQSRLKDYLQTRIRNGEFSERGLATSLGVSQPHIHNVLKGVRLMTPYLADHIISKLKLTLDDLLSEEDFRTFAPRRFGKSPVRGPRSSPS